VQKAVMAQGFRAEPPILSLPLKLEEAEVVELVEVAEVQTLLNVAATDPFMEPVAAEVVWRTVTLRCHAQVESAPTGP
jgi:hypothetical protein